LSSASTAFAHAELVAEPEELLVVGLNGVDLADRVGLLVGVGLKLSVLEAVGFDHFSTLELLLDRVVRRRVAGL
jgi:hypothetical protein